MFCLVFLGLAVWSFLCLTHIMVSMCSSNVLVQAVHQPEASILWVIDFSELYLYQE